MSDTAPAVTTQGEVSSVTVGGLTVSGNDSAESFETLIPEKEDKPITASEAGKKGAEAKKALAKAESREQAREAKAEKLSDEPEIDPEDAEAVEAAIADAKKRHDTKQARMLDATRKESQAKKEAAQHKAALDAKEREAVSLRAELEATRRVSRPRDEAPVPEPGNPVRPADERKAKPTPDQFREPAEYVEAIAEWKADEKLRSFLSEQEERARVIDRGQREYGLVQDFVSEQEKFRTENPQEYETIKDFEKTFTPTFVIHPDQWTSDNMIADAVMLAKGNRYGLIKYLKDHPDEHQFLRGLTDGNEIHAHCRAIVKYALRAPVATTASTERPVSKAHPPVRPVTGAPPSAEDDDDENAPFMAFKAKSDAARRKRMFGTR